MPKAKRTRKFYAVRVGRQPGIYDTWTETEAQVTGFPRASHKSFPTRQEAEVYLGRTIQALVGADAPPRASGDSTTPTASQPANSGPAVPPSASTQTTHLSTAGVGGGAAPVLSDEQKHILNRIIAGDNIFFTGPAGTGKSVLLRAVISAFRDNLRCAGGVGGVEREGAPAPHWEVFGGGGGGSAAKSISGRGAAGGGYGGGERIRGWKLGITASTGMAAVNIGGCTIHSWAGIGLGKLPVEKLYQSILRNKLAVQRWREVDALIIDEISMIPASLLDTLDALARRLRDPLRPFGGIQLIASGDFYQLPPVPDRSDPSGPSTSTPTPTPGIPPSAEFAFESPAWPQLFPPEHNATISLSRVYRQSSSAFISLLDRLRRGSVSDADIRTIRACDRAIAYDDGIEPVSLLASKKEVAAINALRLQKLRTPVQEFISFDEPGVNARGFHLSQEEARVVLDRNTIWADKLELKVGALVMLVVNMQDGQLVNGSSGLVTSFLTLAQAGQKGIYVPERALFWNPSQNVAWPVVEFAVSAHATATNTHLQAGSSNPTRTKDRDKDGNRGTQPKPKTRLVLIPQMSVSVTNPLGTPEAIRHQIPLILAWGMTIHKAQGQSIERLRVDLGRIFERGQTYVALSRATRLDTLEIRNFSADKVMAHPKVIEWSRPMEEEQALEKEWDELAAQVDLDV